MSDADEREQAADPLQEQMDVTDRLARLIAGDDDERFILVFQSLVNVAAGFQDRTEQEQLRHARAVLAQSAQPYVAPRQGGRRAAVAAAPAPALDSVLFDPVFLENMKHLIRKRDRVVGGIPTSEYPDCVAVGSPDQWCCSGTLVAPNVVVTAGHCHADGCASRVLVGDDVDSPNAHVIQVQEAVRHPQYTRPLANDLTVLVLAEDASAEPRALAEEGMLEAAATVRVAGFGYTDVLAGGGYGIRRMVDVPLASSDPKYGADPAKEFVAGAPFLQRDSCNGDSGGPAYVEADRRWYLVGATSRATSSRLLPCGDGGIYTKVRAFWDWVRSIPGGHWG
jgi:secreted trypsin-like serine protease